MRKRHEIWDMVSELEMEKRWMLVVADTFPLSATFMMVRSHYSAEKNGKVIKFRMF